MDALDILNVGQRGPKPMRAPTKVRRPELLHREVAGLVGDKSEQHELPSMVPTTSFKEKRKRDKPVHWEWKAFSNSARTDGACFYHWQKEGVQWDDYAFARFNKTVAVLTYTDRDYEMHFANPEWTKEETDVLLDLCKRFDLRFTVIHDRYPAEKNRSIEDLKARFYFVQKKMLELTGQLTDDQPIVTHPYNKEYEVTRRAHLEKLYSRGKEVEREEAALMDEAKRILLAQKKRESSHKKQRVEGGVVRVTKRGTIVAANQAQLMQSGGVCLRSHLMHSSLDVSPKTQAKVATVLDALGMAKPLASEATAASFSVLRQGIVELLEWQKNLQKKKFEYETLKMKKHDKLKPNKSKKAGAGGGGGGDSSKKAKR